MARKILLIGHRPINDWLCCLCIKRCAVKVINRLIVPLYLLLTLQTPVLKTCRRHHHRCPLHHHCPLHHLSKLKKVIFGLTVWPTLQYKMDSNPPLKMLGAPNVYAAVAGMKCMNFTLPPLVNWFTTLTAPG